MGRSKKKWVQQHHVFQFCSSVFYDQLSALSVSFAFIEKTALQEYQKFISHRKHTEIIVAPSTQDTGLNIEH